MFFLKQLLGVPDENESTEVTIIARNRGTQVLPNGQVVDTEQVLETYVIVKSIYLQSIQ